MNKKANLRLSTEEFDIGKLYQSISSLRQSQDIDWILNMLPEMQFEKVADICCGDGKFMSALLTNDRVGRLAVGIDKSQSMLDATQELLSPYNSEKIKYYLADILLEPAISESFDLITMMSALHWLYPDEQKAFKWVHEHLSPDGLFCFTAYHPLDYKQGYGGTDHLVLEALRNLALPETFPRHFVPMGTRTRQKEEIERLARMHFQLETIETKKAKMSIQNEGEYINYHLATFGSYYLQLLPSYLHSEFLVSLGRVAMERMAQWGYVTNMEVLAFLCRLK